MRITLNAAIVLDRGTNYKESVFQGMYSAR